MDAGHVEGDRDMTDISLIVVGINRWHDITQPFLLSILKHEPEAQILLIDNNSSPAYPNNSSSIEVLRVDERIGYNQAMNIGIQHRKVDKYICFNNDCICEGPFINKIKILDDSTLWGSDHKPDPLNGILFVASAWLVISDKIIEKIKFFDENLSAGFEELDYEMRAMMADFNLGVAQLPIKHLEEMTRLDEPGYLKRWDVCRKYFGKKYGFRTSASGPGRN